MKKITLLLSFSLIISSLAFAQAEIFYPEGLKVGEMAPDFSAKDQDGKTISLKQALQKGPVVMLFYRGQWCPYCNRQLKKLEDSLQLIKEKGARLIAVTPEKPEFISKTIEKTKASYPLLYDKEMK